MPPAGCVRVWRFDLDEVGLDPAVPSSNEHRRAARFRFERDQRRFLAGREVVRRLLGHLVGEAPDRLRLDETAGKPRLADHNLHFNVSHSEHDAVLAVCVDHPVGVDIERLRTVSDARAIARSFFSPAECHVLDWQPDADVDHCFLRAWTRKEAWLKALGIGLIGRTDDFSVTLAPNDPPRLTEIRGDEDEATRWSLYDLPLGPDAVAALAIRANVSVDVVELNDVSASVDDGHRTRDHRTEERRTEERRTEERRTEERRTETRLQS